MPKPPPLSISSKPRILVLLAWHSSAVFRGIAQYAKDAGWVLDSSYERSGEVPEGWRGDGIIGVLGMNPEVDQLINSSRLPFVNIGYSSPSPVPSVSADQKMVARLAVEHFQGLGLRRFIYCLRSAQPGDLGRLAAFQKESRLAGVPVEVLDERLSKSTSSRKRIEWIAGKLKKLPMPAGAFAEIDDYAIEVINAAEEAGLRVPEDLAVLGVGNDELRCPFAPVSLSSVDDNAEGIGREACMLLERVMSGKKPGKVHIDVPPSGVVPRRSTDLLAIEHPQVALAMKAIHRLYREPITAEGIISDVPMSRRRLHDAFVRIVGRSVADEVTRLRVEHAKRLLADTDQKQSQIARESGFRSDSRLVQVFERSTGLSPGEYRRKFNPRFRVSAIVGRPPSGK